MSISSVIKGLESWKFHMNFSSRTTWFPHTSNRTYGFELNAIDPVVRPVGLYFPWVVRYGTALERSIRSVCLPINTGFYRHLKTGVEGKVHRRGFTSWAKLSTVIPTDSIPLKQGTGTTSLQHL